MRKAIAVATSLIVLSVAGAAQAQVEELFEEDNDLIDQTSPSAQRPPLPPGLVQQTGMDPLLKFKLTDILVTVNSGGVPTESISINGRPGVGAGGTGDFPVQPGGDGVDAQGTEAQGIER